MKNLLTILHILLCVIFFQQTVIGQADAWPVKAIRNSGEFLDVKAIDVNGEMLDLVALASENGNYFMDVKILVGDNILPVKLLISNDYYVPVKAIGMKGEIYDVKAITKDGQHLDVKGVSSAGNTIIVAAITQASKFLKLKAISPEGNTRELYGVKFEEENLEMEIMGVKVLAHLKALPSPKVNTQQLVWNVKAIDPYGNSMPVYALGKGGKEYGVKALIVGGSYHLLDVKAIINYNEVSIKLFKKEGKIFLAAIDDMGTIMPVKAKTEEGKYLEIHGVPRGGMIFDIKAQGPVNVKYAVKAISADGDIYDVKGIKVKDRDEEGEFLGFKQSHFYFSHVKAIPPVN